MIDELKALRVEIASLTAERDQLRQSVGGLCHKYDAALAAANARIGKEHDALVTAESALAAARRALTLIESCGHTPCNHIAREALAAPGDGEEGKR